MITASRLATIIALILTTTLTAARAADDRPPISLPWRYVDAQTLAVARLDLAAYNRPALDQWLSTTLRANTDPRTADAVLADLRRGPLLALPESLHAAGASELYAIPSLAHFPASLAWLVIPIPQGSSGDRIAAALFKSLGLTPADPNQPLRAGPLSATVAGDALLISAGDPAPLQHLTPAPRPDLSAAFAATHNAPLALAFSPNPDTRKVIEQMLPQLPPPVSVPSTVLTHGLRTADLALTLPPNPSLTLHIQSDSPADAANLNALVTKFLTLARNSPNFRKAVRNPGPFLDALTPKLDGDRLTLSLTPPAFDQVASLFATGLANARESANRVKSASNLRQIGQGLILYANEHKGAYPDSLAQTTPYFGSPAAFKQATTDPRFPDKPNPYTYLKPAGTTTTTPPETVVAYESFDPHHWPDGINALFADGHVEFIGRQAQFQSLLTKSKSPSKQP